MTRITRHEMIAIRALQLRACTEHYCYRPVALADMHPLFEASRNLGEHYAINWPIPKTPDEAKMYIHEILAEELLNTSVTSTIVCKPTGKWLGLVRWVPFQDSIAVQFRTQSKLWEKGAEELLNNSLHFIYRFTSISHVYAIMAPSNNARLFAQNKGMMLCNESKRADVFRSTKPNHTQA